MIHGVLIAVAVVSVLLRLLLNVVSCYEVPREFQGTVVLSVFMVGMLKFHDKMHLAPYFAIGLIVLK